MAENSTESGPAPVDQAVTDLQKAVAESSAAIAADAGIPPRGRGRPKGSKTRGRSRRDRPRAAEPAAPAADPVQTAAAALPAPLDQGGMAFDAGTMIGGGIKMVFDGRARKTGFDGWRMERDEANEYGSQLGQALEAWVPGFAEKNPKLFTLAFCAGSLAVAAITRQSDYLDWLEKQEPKPAAPTQTTPGADTPALGAGPGTAPERETARPKVSARDFFGPQAETGWGPSRTA